MNPNKLIKTPEIIKNNPQTNQNTPEKEPDKHEDDNETIQPETESEKKTEKEEQFVDFSQLFNKDGGPIKNM